MDRPQCRTILQNPDDLRLFSEEIGVAPARLRMIRGAGVDLTHFRPKPEPDGPPVAVCVSRMLWDKGIGELVEAARRLKADGVPLKVRLVGATDDNPASIPQKTLADWAAEGVVEVAGPTDDVAGEYARAHIAVLPSYREGLPKSLLEAAASGRAMVATDVPGCREICRQDETGLLVAPRSVSEIVVALKRLVRDPGLRRRLANNARRVAAAEFGEEIVVRETLRLYEEMLNGAP
jgi:glycosyltransferase involved in cell wall biosynthesis